MQATPNCSGRVLRVAAAFLTVTLASVAQADIFQWKYINPAEPSQGKQQSTTLAPDGAGVDAIAGANLSSRNLTKAYLAGADLTDTKGSSANLTDADLSHANLTIATFSFATLTGADFTLAEVREASFDIGVALIFGPPTWEIGTGITLPQLYSTASYQAHDLTGISLGANHLSSGNFAGQNLSNANFGGATLTGADFTNAEVRGTRFDQSVVVVCPPECLHNYGSGITLAQLYSTASYKASDLSGIGLDYNNLSGGNFVGQYLANARFYYATLTGADFTAADARGTSGFDSSATTTTNLIRPNGQIGGLDLNGGGLLVVRDYDGDFRYEPALPPIPITVDQHLAMGPGGRLRMVFEADAWDSTISFAPGIPVTLGGTLELTFAADVNLASQVGRTFRVFDWSGVNPAGAFAVSSLYAWDISNLYATGEVTLVGVPEPCGFFLFSLAFAALIATRRARLLVDS